MSYHAAADPVCEAQTGPVALTIRPRERDLGGFTVRRVLPASARQMVGPFIFFDEMGPAQFPPGRGIQVRPHPHIGLATITYLFEGEMFHRDSLGNALPIRPGAVNLMTAGRGIVHSERAGDDLNQTSRLHGIQSWIALPDAEEDRAPAFTHYRADDLPEFSHEGSRVRIIIGEAWGRRSPVTAYSPTLYLELEIPTGNTITLPTQRELGAYLVHGSARIGREPLAAGTMALAPPGEALTLSAEQDSRIMVIGGDPVGERHIWWNLVASTPERIDAAKARWQSGAFDPVPGETEFIPLPE
jgi:redox-sensitive bicupin YhaK (pirin superfamily)